MSLSNSPSRVDQDAKVIRERFELAVVSGNALEIIDAARELFWFCSDHPEYALCRMWPPADAAVVEPPKRIESKFESRCKKCRTIILPGAECLWEPGGKGVTCLACGGAK